MTALALQFSDLGTPLSECTFIVVDLETTGGAPRDAGITEIGAVKVKGGEVIAEFRTFVNPGQSIPAYITILTGIADYHVAEAPPVTTAIIDFLAFADWLPDETRDRSSRPVLVAHNAPYDKGFLMAATARAGLTWAAPHVIDTAALARKVLSRDDVLNRKLGTLAQYFRSETTPNHRALDDARATVHVLNGLFERIGNLGVEYLEDVLTYQGKATERRRKKRHLADNLPSTSGVYIFYDVKDQPLYIGTSNNIRKRVMSYFTGAETRRKINSMVELAHRVQAIECRTPLESRIRELRLIAEHQPRFNHKSRFPERVVWIGLTKERFPRLTVIRDVNPAFDERIVIGPFRNREFATQAIDALSEVTGLRQCKDRITATSKQSGCVLFEMNKCCAPCRDGSQMELHNSAVEHTTAILLGQQTQWHSSLTQRLSTLAQESRFEEASVIRDRIFATGQAIHSSAQLRMLMSHELIVAGSLATDSGWDVHVISRGRLIGAGHIAKGSDVHSAIDAIVSTSSTESELIPSFEESSLLLRWLNTPGVRLIRMSNETGLHVPIGATPHVIQRIDLSALTVV